MLKVVSRLCNERMYIFHGIAQLDTESTENISLPSVILGIDPRLDLLIVDDAYTQRFLRVRGVKCRSRFLNLREELLPKLEIFA